MPAHIVGTIDCAAARDDGARGVFLDAGGRGPSSLRDGPLSVVADASFHDHEDLARALDQPRDASPARLIAAAWRARGEDCVTLFDGDFAFALYDASQRVLFLARDPFGIRPLHYRVSRGRFAFGSSIAALREVLGDDGTFSDCTFSDRAMADFVLGRVSDAEGTFYRDIRRFPAAHRIAVRTGDELPERYWSLTPDPQAAQEPEPARRFRALFERAVQRRMRRAMRPAALLSGGLDSSSIACTARELAPATTLPTFSMVFTAPAQCNERRFIDAVVDQGGFAPTIIARDGYKPFAGIESLLAALDGPVLAPNIACIDPLIARARAEGTDVLLDGHGGDEVVSHGYGRLHDLARNRNWPLLWREATAARDNYGNSTARVVQGIARRHRGLDARMVNKVLGLFLRGKGGGAPRPHLLARDLIERCDLSGPAATIRHDSGEAEQHLATLSDPLQAYAFEVLARFYRAHGIEPRFPFWDRDLVRLCVGLPGSAKLSGGWSRRVLRDAMRGVIPEAVRQRRDKLNFGYHLANGMVRHHDEMIRDLLEGGAGAGGIDDYVDLAAARQVYARIAADPASAPGPEVQQIWRIVMLATWLNMERGAGSRRAQDRFQPAQPNLAGARP